MSEYQEFTGKSVEEAIKAACDAFGVGLGDLDFEILTPGSRGVLGMGAEPARIVAAPRSALGGAAPKREAAESTPLPAAPRPREDRPYGAGDRGGDRGPRRDYGDRPPRQDYGDRPPRRDDRAPAAPRGDDRPPRTADRPPRRDDRPPRRDDRGPRRDDRAARPTSRRRSELSAAGAVAGAATAGGTAAG